MSGFTGFPEQALDFYEGLEADNSKAYWTDHKAVYDDAVAAPMRALLVELEPRFGAAKFFRPYRDVRFSKDKSPYKTAAAATCHDGDGNGTLYVQLSASGLLLAAGFYDMAADQVDRYRVAVADGGSGPALVRLVRSLERDGCSIGGDTITRPPRGYPADHPRLDLLRHKSLTAWRSFEPAPWLATPVALDRVVEVWDSFAPLNRWLAKHVGRARPKGTDPSSVIG